MAFHQHVLMNYWRWSPGSSCPTDILSMVTSHLFAHDKKVGYVRSYRPGRSARSLPSLSLAHDLCLACICVLDALKVPRLWPGPSLCLTLVNNIRRSSTGCHVGASRRQRLNVNSAHVKVKITSNCTEFVARKWLLILKFKKFPSWVTVLKSLLQL